MPDARPTTYPSVVMGAGEQRLFKLLYAVEMSHEDGLILVDELDLLMHGDALKRLITHLSDRCRAKRLQLVFTSHREELLPLKDQINIRHLWPQAGKHYCYSNTDPDSLQRLTGNRERRLEMFVEDDLPPQLGGRPDEPRIAPPNAVETVRVSGRRSLPATGLCGGILIGPRR